MQAGRVSGFLQRVECECQRRRLLLRSQKILVAVSGGVDSMVLLHVLNALAKKQRWRISVAHFNHQLRGRASEADEKLVRQTTGKLQLPFWTERGEVARFATQSKISVEMSARKLRHEFLARVAREQKIFTIALAHHADDQVEPFFLRLLRGAGGEGLAGMKWRSPSPADGKITLVRPLLGCSKTELLDFARENKIPFRDDATNFSEDFLRNRIRNELLPLLQTKYQPGLVKTVLRTMEIIGAEAEFVSEAARRWERRHPAGVNPNSTPPRADKMPALPETGFEILPVAVQRKILQRQLTEAGLVSDFELVEHLRNAPGKFVSVSSGWSVALAADGKISLREKFETPFNVAELKLKLPNRAGRAKFSGCKFRWQIRPRKAFRLPQKPDGGETFDADKIGGEIVLRHWRAGDRFQPMGLPSPVKLQDLFVNAKIPAARRRDLILAATAGGEIFWVEDLRIGEPFKLLPETRRKLVWNWSKAAA
jgi:tRNA(Ile)-lysidine synthase